MRDFVTGEELTADNLIRCLNEYLNKIKVIDKDEMEILLSYIEVALKIGGVDLAQATIDTIKVDFLYRYD